MESTAAIVERMSVDEALVRRARLGDAVAFERLMADRLDRAYRLAWSILLSDADSADAIQDAFLSAWRQLPRLRNPSVFDGWLNRIVANAARMVRRRRVRLREIPVDLQGGRDRTTAPDGRSASATGGADLDRVADRDSISRAFDRLGANDRAILALHYVDGRPVAEIARTLAIPTGTVKWRLHRARRALERAMEAEA